MYFRCSECLAATWLDRIEPPRDGDELSCGECGGAHVARPLRGLGSTLAEHYQRALKLSQTEGLDMATAYSSLLGVIPQDELTFLQGSAPAEGAPEPVGVPAGPAQSASPSAEGSSAPVAAPPQAKLVLTHFDPSFQPAVDAGVLSVRAAVERGDRKVFAMRLVRRHDIDCGLALLVADNRISLHEAVRRKAEKLAPPTPRRGTSRGQKLAVFSTALAGVLLATWFQWNGAFVPRPEISAATASPGTSPTPGVEASPTPIGASTPAQVVPAVSPVAIKRDEEGRMLEIAGPDPASVLTAYCRATPSGRLLEPLEITQTVPPLGVARLGVFRDYGSLEAPRAIWMRRDWRTRRWVAGDGKGPIPVREAPAIPPDGFRKTVQVDDRPDS